MRFERTAIGDRRVATDGGAMYEDDDDTEYTVYTSDEYHYQIEYPTEWVAETDPPGGMFFSAQEGDSPSAFVFVDDETETSVSLSDYIEGFFAELADDRYISTFERQGSQTTTLSSGQSGTIIEFTYTDDVPCKRWDCRYLFAIADGTGYTVGVEWAATEQFEANATGIIDSFTLVDDAHNESDPENHRDTADSRSATQRTENDQ